MLGNRTKQLNELNINPRERGNLIIQFYQI
jgi:hypothetical protein